jgi:type VI secretion system lysozyme-like protein
MDDYTPSVFDRLSDPSIPVGRSRYTLRQLEHAVLRDLSDLLNTKRPAEGTFDGLGLVPDSIANYGLKDMTMVHGYTAGEREVYAQHIAHVIAAFEPRLTDVVVVARDPAEVREERPTQFNLAAMYFRIRATLNVDPTPIEGVTFDTVFELTSGHHQVHLPGATT